MCDSAQRRAGRVTRRRLAGARLQGKIAARRASGRERARTRLTKSRMACEVAMTVWSQMPSRAQSDRPTASPSEKRDAGFSAAFFVTLVAGRYSEAFGRCFAAWLADCSPHVPSRMM
eukprot:scaffold13627_cov109-Isochrysis_galbana.AAC.7